MRVTPIPKSEPLPLWQSDDWAATLRTLGRCAWVEPLGPVGQALIVTRQIGPFGRIRFTSRGPVWAKGVTVEDQVEALKTAGLHILNVGSVEPGMMKAAGYLRLFRPKQIAILPTYENMEDQLAQARGKWRNAARQAQRKRLWCSHDPFETTKHGWIFQKDRQQAQAKGFRNMHPALVRAFDLTNPGQTLVTQMWDGEHPVAAMIFLTHGTAATYQIGWTSAEGRAARAHHLMLVEAASKLARRGVQHIDLGLYDPKGSSGLARFKKGAGARIEALGGTWIKRPF